VAIGLLQHTDRDVFITSPLEGEVGASARRVWGKASKFHCAPLTANFAPGVPVTKFASLDGPRSRFTVRIRTWAVYVDVKRTPLPRHCEEQRDVAIGWFQHNDRYDFMTSPPLGGEVAPSAARVRGKPQSCTVHQLTANFAPGVPVTKFASLDGTRSRYTARIRT
jgi:hypothetical protein